MLTAALIKGPGIWPGIFAGAFFGNITAYFSAESVTAVVQYLIAASLNGAGDTIGALCAAYLIRRYTGTTMPLKVSRDVLIFVVAGALCCSSISAVMGVTPLWFFGQLGGNSFGMAFSTWLTGDAVGILVFAPILLAICHKHKPFIKQRASVVVLAFAIIAISLLGTGVITNDPIKVALVLLIPVLIWSIFFLDYGVTYGSLILMSTVVVIKAVSGADFNSSPNGILEIQIFLALVSVTILLTQALVLERAQVSQQLFQFQTQLKERLAQQSQELSQRETDIKQALFFYQYRHLEI